MASTLRIWASEDGESHLEDVDLAFEESDFLPPAPPMHLTARTPASGYFIARVPPGWHADWHPAPVRELAVYLTGEGEIEASDGTVRSLRPGTILLVDDTTGKGHITRVTGTEELVVVIVTLPDDPTPV
jgi:oxalate decarboxylase/phosphoglucose isomerase-like protein (cupin superfamily)